MDSIVILVCLIQSMLHMKFESNWPCVFACFVALRPKSTAMVMAGRSVQLTTLFPGQA